MNTPVSFSLSSTTGERGLTLVELLVALAAGLILSLGIAQIFVGSKASYRFSDGLARLQESGRFAIDYLTQDVRMAGYLGCFRGGGSSVENLLNNPATFAWDLNNMVRGYDNVAANFGAIPNVLPGTDVLAIRMMADNGVRLVKPYSDSAQLFVDDTVTSQQIAIGDILLVSDCAKASIFQATNVQAAGGKIDIPHSQAAISPGNSQPLLNNSYGEGSQIARLVTSAFFVRQDAGRRPGLYRTALTTVNGNAAQLQSEELLEGVEDMQVLYGVDSDGDAVIDQYVTATNVGAWAQVMSVRVALLVESTEEVNTQLDTKTYDLVGNTADPVDDRRLRQVFVSTITLRNRVP